MKGDLCFMAILVFLNLTLGSARRIPRDAPTCPPGVSPVNCALNPCDFATCRKYPGATCVPNYCESCKPDFYVSGAKVDCACKADIVNCLVDPCSTKNCDPGKICISNYCGGCNADCFDV